MARIAGINIPNHQHAEIALTAIYGIGRARAQAICVAAGVPGSRKIKDLNDAKAEVYAEAEPEFDKTALKAVVKRRRKARNIVDSEDFTIAQYERALAGWDGTPLGDAANGTRAEAQPATPMTPAEYLPPPSRLLSAPRRLLPAPSGVEQ